MVHLDLVTDIAGNLCEGVGLVTEAAQAIVHIQHEVVEVGPLELQPRAQSRVQHWLPDIVVPTQGDLRYGDSAAQSILMVTQQT